MGEVGVQWNALVGELGMACPDGTMPIVSSTWACLAALHYIGKDAGLYLGTENDPTFPKGCYEFAFTENLAFVFMNEHETGALQSQSRSFCHQNLEPLPPGEVVFLGDSDIDFWTTSTDIVPKSLNVGIGGHLCSEVLQDVDSLLEEAKPSTVVLVCGRYDLAQNTTVADTFDLFSGIVEKINDAGSHVLYLGTKPEPANQDLHELYQDYDKLVNDHAISLAEDVADPPLTFIDVYSAFVDLGNPFDLYQASDQESLALYGYELWSNWTVAALDDNDEVPCVVWKSGECVVRSTFSGTASPIAATATAEPSTSPSENPAASPSGSPTVAGVTVTSNPTASPSGSPTVAGITVTSDPTGSPSGSPTVAGITVTSDPTASPSGSPSPAPSVRVVSTDTPTYQPVNSPVTENPSRAPVSGTDMPIGRVTFVPIIAMAVVAHLFF